MKIELRKRIFFGSKKFFHEYVFKNGCKSELNDKNEKNAADQEIGFLLKSISKPYGRATAMPPAWALM